MSISVVHNDMSYNSIRNYTFDQFYTLFKTTELDISSFWLINSGYDENGEKKYVHLIIRACQIRPFFGPHLVSIYKPDKTLNTMWVNSLTHLRRNIFKFTDRLSFERSTYLIPFQDSDTLVRIKSIRCFLLIPIIQKYSSEIKLEKPASPKKQPKVKQQLLDTCLQTMVTYIDRELAGTTEETVTELKEIVDQFCDHLLTMSCKRQERQGST